MLRIAILSDSHGYLGDTAWMQDCDEIWHGGDWGNGVLEQLPAGKTLRGVWGNIDGPDIRQRFPEELCFEVEGIRVYLRHIGGYPGHYAPGVKQRLLHVQPQLFVCGHSHILRIMRDPALGGMLYINPGAIGRSGLHRLRTAVRMTVQGGRMADVQVVELGPRSGHR